tara:strand:+ start:320 stop:499 length:180 start_codon:yes stop_codon:yes gene_type:complete
LEALRNVFVKEEPVEDANPEKAEKVRANADVDAEPSADAKAEREVDVVLPVTNAGVKLF